MKLSTKNNDLNQEPTRRTSSKTTSSTKKVYWKMGERNSRFAFLKHWAALSTLGMGVIATIAVTTLFNRENKGTYYKSKFLSPVASQIEDITNHSESNSSGNNSASTSIHPRIAIYTPPFFGSSSDLANPKSNLEVVGVVSTGTTQEEQKQHNLTNGEYVEELVTEEELPLSNRGASMLNVPAYAGLSLGPKQPSDYFNSGKKQRFMGRFKVGAEVGLGLSKFNVKDARTTDSQVVTDVQVKPELSKSYGFVAQAEVFRNFSVGTGFYENSYSSTIIPRFIPDTTGSGFNWPPPPPPGGEGEEHEEHNEHGEGENVIQFAEGGYDVVTNTGVTHVMHDMDEDLSILSGSKEYFTYYSIPLQVSYSLRYRKFQFELGTGVQYNHLKTSYAQFNVLDDNKYSTQRSDIVGLNSHYFSHTANLGVQYKLSYRLSVGATFKCNYALSNMNTATPFLTRLNTWAGMAGVYYNF